MNKIRFVVTSSEGNYYLDKSVPFVPNSSDDRIYLPADKEGKLGVFTFQNKSWSALSGELSQTIVVNVLPYDPRFISGGYKLSEAKGWVRFEETEKWLNEFRP